MTYQTISIDRRSDYYRRLAALIEAMPPNRRNVAWALVEARKSEGRRIQAAIKPKDLQPFSAKAAPALIAPIDITTARERRAHRSHR